MRCSAVVQGCSAEATRPAATAAKGSSVADGTAARLISRSSQQNGRGPASCRQTTASSGAPAGTVDAVAVRPRRPASSPRQHREAIGQAERRDVGGDVADLEQRRLGARAHDEAAGLAPPLDQPGAGQLVSALLTVMREQPKSSVSSCS